MSLGYILNEGVAGFKRAKLASFTSIFSLFVAVFLLGVLARFSYNGYEAAQALQQKVNVELFLDDNSDKLKDNIQEKLVQQKLVSQVNYISKDSAAAVFKEEFGTEGASLAELNFLPASFRVNIAEGAEISRIDSLVKVFRTYEGVEDVSFNQKLLAKFKLNFQRIVAIGSIIGGLILLASVILVFNTIRLTIYAKRSLIKAMKLVGATNAFIRRPFLVEGIIQGLIAALLALFVMFITFQFVLPEYVPQVGILEWPFGRWYYLSGAMVLLSVLMGFWGSQWAARRFIRKTSISE